MRVAVLHVVAAAVLAIFAPAARASTPRWAEFLPASSWVDEDLLVLRALGLLPDLPSATRPLARTDVAAALLAARARRPDVERNPVFRRLWRELAREIGELATGDSTRSGPLPRETPPLLEIGGARAAGRAYAYASGLARGSPDSTIDLLPGTRAGVRVHLRLPHGLGAFEEWTIGRFQDARRYGDYIAGIEDLAEDVPRVYVSAAIGSTRLQVGRDAARWGPGVDGTLLLSDAAGPATTLAATGTLWKRLTASVRTDVLSAERGRYLAAHRLEWRPSAALTLGLAEAAVYVSRAPEPLYLLGILPYTIVQRKVSEDAANDSLLARLRNNLEASLDVSWRPAAGWEARAEGLIDDVQLSGTDTQNRGALQVGLTRVGAVGAGRVALSAEYTRVTRFTGSVWYGEDGDRDFQTADRPLGFWLGPGSEDALARIGWDPSPALHLALSLQQTRRGAEGLGAPWTPGDSTTSGFDFAGPVERARSAIVALRLQPADTVLLQGALGVLDVRNAGNVDGARRRGPVGWISAEIRR